MDDLVKRLRGYGSNRCWPHGPACDCTQAADRIEELEQGLQVTCEREAATTARYDTRIEALEAQVRAADKLAEALTAYNRGGAGPLTGWLDVEQALAAYRATKEGGE